MIELRADLGGGKTTFVRGLAKGLGSRDTVSSPTFTLNQIYKGRQNMEIHHYDFYRLREAGVLSDQLSESLSSKSTVTVVEWSDIVEDVLPQDRLTIELKLDETNTDARILNFKYPASKLPLIQKLKAAWKEVRP